MEAILDTGIISLDEELTPLQDELVEAMADLTVPHGVFEAAYKKIISTIKHNKARKATEPICMLILGEPGTGKSTLLESIEHVLPKPYEVEDEFEVVRKVPFFHSSLNQDSTPKQMAADILKSMGVAGRSHHGSIERLQMALSKAGTIAFQYDEMHNMAGNMTPARIGKARGFVKDLITNTGVMIIGYGTPSCEDIFLSEAQVARRFPHIIRLGSFAFSLDGSRPYAQVVNAFEEKILEYKDCFPEVEHRLNKTFLTQLYAASAGNINGLKKLYEEAVWLGVTEGRPFDSVLFAEAHDNLKLKCCVPILDNPFRMDRARLVERIQNWSMSNQSWCGDDQ